MALEFDAMVGDFVEKADTEEYTPRQYPRRPDRTGKPAMYKSSKPDRVAFEEMNAEDQAERNRSDISAAFARLKKLEDRMDDHHSNYLRLCGFVNKLADMLMELVGKQR